MFDKKQFSVGGMLNKSMLLYCKKISDRDSIGKSPKLFGNLPENYTACEESDGEIVVGGLTEDGLSIHNHLTSRRNPHPPNFIGFSEHTCFGRSRNN